MKFVRAQPNKRAVCVELGVNRSTIYYKSRRKPDELESLVMQIFKKHLSNYGSRRIKQELAKQGILISKKRICNILKKNDLEPKYGRRKLARNIHTNKDERYIAENLTLNKKPTTSNHTVHTDFTEFKCSDGKLFVSGIIDAFDRRVVIKCAERATKELVIDTLKLLKKPPKILHSDRGPQYTSTLLRDYCIKENIKRSMSAPYCSCQNALIESFWKTLKIEVGETKHRSKKELKMVLKYQINYYNNERMHSSIGYHTPVEFFTLYGVNPIQTKESA